MRHNAAAAASRSTIGYSKGRSAANTVHAKAIYNDPAPAVVKRKDGPIARSASNMSQSSERSDTTITPENYAEEVGPGSEEWGQIKFLGAFSGDDALGRSGALPECLRGEDEEEFVMTLGEGN